MMVDHPISCFLAPLLAKCGSKSVGDPQDVVVVFKSLTGYQIMIHEWYLVTNKPLNLSDTFYS